MLQPKANQLRFVNLSAPVLRIALLVPIALMAVCSWYAVRWCAGDAIAETAPALEQGAMDAAQTAVRLAPDDPRTHWAVATLQKQSFDEEDLQAAAQRYTKAVSLSPNDYRLWMDLGRAHAEAGDAAEAEQALRRAVELAPSYAQPRWHLGNFLLRAGRYDEAFAELARAGAADTSLLPQIFTLAWRVYKGDVHTVENAVGRSATTRAQLAIFLVAVGRADDAIMLWATLSAEEKEEQRATGEALMSALLGAKRFHAALDLVRALAVPGGKQTPRPEQFTDGSFEGDVGAPGATAFDWQVKPVPQASITLDKLVRHGGARSLRVVFNAPANLTFNNIAQTVVVEPQARYRFECQVRTKDLNSAGAPVIEIVDAANGGRLGASQPLAAGTSEWDPVTINFATGAGTEAVTVRVVRASCGTDVVCPIFGTVWYDDFDLQRVGGSSGQRSTGNSTARSTSKH